MPIMEVTVDEARHLITRRGSMIRDEYFREGLEAAAAEVMQWDGAIEDESMRRQIAHAIRRLKRQRNKKPKET